MFLDLRAAVKFFLVHGFEDGFLLVPLGHELVVLLPQRDHRILQFLQLLLRDGFVGPAHRVRSLQVDL